MERDADDTAADIRAQIDVLKAELDRDWPDGVDLEQIGDPEQRTRVIAADEKLRELTDQGDQLDVG